MKSTKQLTSAALIAALYVILSFISGMFGLSSNLFQLRISDALCVLSALTPAGIWGVSIGCLLYNILSGGPIWDIIIGTAASFIGCLGVYGLSRISFVTKRGTLWPLLLPVPYILANTFLIPFVFILLGTFGNAYFVFALCIFAGEFFSCEIFGTLLYIAVLPKFTKK